MNDRWKGERSDQFTGVDDAAGAVEVVLWCVRACLACFAVCARWCAVWWVALCVVVAAGVVVVVPAVCAKAATGRASVMMPARSSLRIVEAPQGP